MSVKTYDKLIGAIIRVREIKESLKPVSNVELEKKGRINVLLGILEDDLTEAKNKT